MKLSKLIIVLKELLSKNGDGEVYFLENGKSEPTKVEVAVYDNEYEKQKKPKFVIGDKDFKEFIDSANEDYDE